MHTVQQQQRQIYTPNAVVELLLLRQYGKTTVCAVYDLHLGMTHHEKFEVMELRNLYIITVWQHVQIIKLHRVKFTRLSEMFTLIVW